MGTIAGALGQRETRLQSGFELQVLKERLKNNRSTKGRKLLIFEAKAWDLVKTGQMACLLFLTCGFLLKRARCCYWPT